MSVFVLDTDTLTLFLKGKEHMCRRVVQLKADQLAVTIINVEESLQQTLDVLQDFRVLGFDANAIATYHKLRKTYRKTGTNDLRIAAIVLNDAAMLITRNLKDFGQIAGLAVEDWSQSAAPI